MACFLALNGAEAAGEQLAGLARNEPLRYAKNSPIVAAVIAGEIDWGLVNHYYLWRALAEDPDVPAKNFFMRGKDGSSFINIAGVALLRDDPRALELVEFLLDEQARHQTNRFGLILVEGFFDVAKLVEADCRNVGALMGTAISAQQIERLAWIRTRVGFPHILLFLDRDQAGRNAMRQARKRLRQHNLAVSVFDWDQKISCHGQGAERIPESIQDPADMPVEQLRELRRQGII